MPRTLLTTATVSVVWPVCLLACTLVSCLPTTQQGKSPRREAVDYINGRGGKVIYFTGDTVLGPGVEGRCLVEWQEVQLTAQDMAMLLRLKDDVFSLDLRRCQIPEQSFPNFKNFGQVQRLDLSFTNAGDEAASAIQGHRQLSKLTMYGCPITDRGVRDLANLQNLSELYLNGTQVTDIAMKYVAKLSRLAWFDIGNTASFTGRHLGLLPATVTKLEVRAKTQSEVLQYLEGNTNLRELRVYFNGSDRGLVSLRKIPNLEELNLSSTGTTDEGLRHVGTLRHLQVLKLANTKITDQGLAHLSGLKELKRLHLERTQLASNGILQLRDLQKLDYLGLRDTTVSRDVRAEFHRHNPRVSFGVR